MYIGMGLDMALALEKLRPGYEARQYIIYAEYLLSQPHIKEGIDKALEDAGGGLHNKNEFIAFITRMAQRGSEKERLSAWRILARLHGIGEDAGTERPTELPVSFNTGDGLKQMLGEEVYNEVALAKE